MGRRLRALLLAEAANPEWVSVPLVGWSLARAVAALTDAHLVTQVRNREALARAGLVEDADFTAIDSEATARWLWKLSSLLRAGDGAGWTTVSAFATVGYYHFEHLVWKRFGSRIRDGEWDVVHRITPLSPTTPSLLAARCRAANVPFVIGPLNGGVPWPRQFDAVRRQEREWLSYVRAAYRLLPGHRSTLRDAAALLVGSRDTWAQMPASERCLYLPENGVDPARFGAQRTRAAAAPLRGVFVGRLVPYKGADMLIEAAAPLVRAGRLVLTVVGDGPQRPELEALVAREGLAPGVTLAGWVEHARLPELLAQADLFTFPSIREFGGGVVLEAMAVGLVPVIVDYAGPAELVTPETGYAVPLGTRAEIVERLGALLARLADRPEEIDEKSRAAARRVREHFTWPVKAGKVLEVYRWVTGRAARPEFPMPTP